ncbi:unnamed protein product [uncultured bacterium]|nr:unnamed protein product [uncultured bacterium]
MPHRCTIPGCAICLIFSLAAEIVHGADIEQSPSASVGTPAVSGAITAAAPQGENASFFVANAITDEEYGAPVLPDKGGVGLKDDR